MGRKRTSIFRPWEGARSSFTGIFHDMMDSEAWQALTLRQQGLYLHLKRKYRPKIKSGRYISSNENDISIPKAEAQKLYGDLRTFRADLDALIDHGFMKLVHSGYTTREPNIYGFSARWQDYGKPGFAIPKIEKRSGKDTS